MAFTVIFSNDYSLHNIKLNGEIIVSKQNKIATETDCVTVIPILGKVCGIHWQQQRPSRVIIEEPKDLYNVCDHHKYIRWLTQAVCNCGSFTASYLYKRNNKVHYFLTEKHFCEWIKENIGGAHG